MCLPIKEILCTQLASLAKVSQKQRRRASDQLTLTMSMSSGNNHVFKGNSEIFFFCVSTHIYEKSCFPVE